MQWKIGHVVSIVVALAVGGAVGFVVAKGLEPSSVTAVEPGTDASKTEGQAPVEEFVKGDPDASYLVVERRKGDAGDLLWLTPGVRVPEIEQSEGSLLVVGRVDFLALCRKPHECQDCEDLDPDDCPVPQPPQPGPGIRLHPDELRLHVGVGDR